VVGEPITGDRLRVTFTLDGKNFFPDPADCTLQFARLTQTSPDRDAERTFVVVAGPRGAGTLSCAKVEAVRQEGLVVSLEAVFRLEPIETFPPRS
ncbi:MAG: hypothetical protein M3N51_10800, partial [Actinomycetota bacterium]|nr:hypothetical protein [Actinomycetota bacterium]